MEFEEGGDEATMTTKYDRPENQKSLIGRFRRVRKAQTPTSKNGQDKRDQTPSPPMESYPTARANRDGAPSKLLVAQSSDSTSMDAIKSPKTPSSDPWDRVTRETKSKLKSHLPIRETVTLTKPPTAQEAAFGGPPRFDWIDIETAAAIKVQTAYRRNKVMWTMEQNGMSTAAIRNRSRRRKALQRFEGGAFSNLFNCCGVGIAFGDDFEVAEDYQTSRDMQKQQYEEKRKAQLEHESELRANFRKNQIAHKNAEGNMEEAYEIVE